MFRYSVFIFTFLAFFGASCKTVFTPRSTQYVISVLLVNDYNEVNRVMSICSPLQPVGQEVLTLPASDRLVVVSRFFDKGNDIIERVRQELLALRQVLTVQINKSYR